MELSNSYVLAVFSIHNLNQWHQWTNSQWLTQHQVSNHRSVKYNIYIPILRILSTTMKTWAPALRRLRGLPKLHISKHQKLKDRTDGMRNSGSPWLSSWWPRKCLFLFPQDSFLLAHHFSKCQASTVNHILQNTFYSEKLHSFHPRVVVNFFDHSILQVSSGIIPLLTSTDNE